MLLSDSWTALQVPVARVGAAEAVFSSLRTAIESGELPVGVKLSSEVALGHQYGVSRSVVREALRSLNALSYCMTKTGKGTFVIANRVPKDLQLGRYSARDLLEARPHIEIPAAELAAERRSDEDVEALNAILTAMSDEDDVHKWVQLDSAFHAGIARASGNRVFESVIADMRDAMASQSETLTIVGRRQSASNDEHRRILAAIEQRSARAAGDCMRTHLDAVGEALGEILHELRKGDS
jgi:GntR family transcriptional repressor for pyruvate dehydrogenase complex